MGVKEGQVLMLMGSADKVPEAPKEKVVFVEDMNEDQISALSVYPPGLGNLGNTCYLNSVLQFLKSAPEVKNELKKYSPAGPSNGEPSIALATQMREMMTQLDRNAASFSPQAFVMSFRTLFPMYAQTGPQGQFMQQDAQECYSTVVQTVGRAIPKVNELLEVEMETTYKCVEAEDEPTTSKREKVHALTCHISNETSNLMTGLMDKLTETVEKHSPTLGRTAHYTQESRLAKLPEYLCVQFMRFFWKPNEQVRAKILRRVAFPFILDVSKLCSEPLSKEIRGLRAQIAEAEEAARAERLAKAEAAAIGAGKTADGAEAMDTSAAGTSAGAADAPAPLDIDLDGKDTGLYDLCGVITHTGRSASGGHYMAWTKEEGTGRWLHYDDDKVKEVKEEDIKNLAGGGDWAIGYLLLYRKKRSNVSDGLLAQG